MLVTEEELKKVNGFVSKKTYKLPFYLAKNQTPKIFSSSTIATTYILNQQGKIVLAENGAVDWNSEKIRTFLDKLLSE